MPASGYFTALPRGQTIREVLELVLLDFAVPAIIYFGRFRLHALAMLWMVAAYCLWVLQVQGRLELAALQTSGLGNQLPPILSLYLPFVLITTVFVYRFSRRDFFSLVRNRPGFWAFIMLGYPVLSVYPQGIIFRAFFFHRYRDLFPDRWVLVLVSAVAFAYMHIVFRNWLALALTASGGVIVCRALRPDSLAAHLLLRTHSVWLLDFHRGIGTFFSISRTTSAGGFVVRTRGKCKLTEGLHWQQTSNFQNKLARTRLLP